MEILVRLMAVLGAIALGVIFWLWRRQERQQRQWNEQRREFENMLNQQRQENKARSQQLEQSRQEIITLQKFQNQQSSQIQTLEIRLEDSRQEKTEIEARLRTEIQTLQDSQEKTNQELTKIIPNVQIARAELTQHIQALESKLETTVQEKIEILTQLNTEIQELQDSQEKIDQELSVKIAKLYAAWYEFVPQLDALQMRLKMAVEGKEEIEKRLNTEIQNFQNSQAKIEQALNARVTSLQAAQNELLQQIKALQTQLDMAAQEKVEISTQLKPEIDVIPDAQQELNARISNFQSAQDELLQQIQALQIQLETAVQEQAEITTQLKTEIIYLKHSQPRIRFEFTRGLAKIKATQDELQQKFSYFIYHLESFVQQRLSIKQTLNSKIRKLISIEKAENEAFQNWQTQKSNFEQQLLEQGKDIRNMGEIEQQLMKQISQLQAEVDEFKQEIVKQREIYEQRIREKEQWVYSTLEDLENEKTGMEIRITMQTQRLEQLEQENREIKDQFNHAIQELEKYQSLVDSHEKKLPGGEIKTIDHDSLTQPDSAQEVDVKPVSKGALLPYPPYEKILGKLAKYLSKREWKKADQETVKILLDSAYKSDVDDLDQEAFASIPRKLWQAIDLLWRVASDHRFGFSLQQELWWQITGDGKGDDKTRKAFCDRIGWRKNGEWLDLDELTYNLSAPVGHLPALGLHLGGLSWGVKHFSWGRRESFEYFLSWVAIAEDER